MTTAIKKNDSLSGTPASIGKFNEKPNNTIAYTTPSVTTAEKQKEHAELMITPTKTATLVTSDRKIDLTSTITLNDKTSTATTAAPNITTTITAITDTATGFTTTTNAVPTQTSNYSNITTAVPVTTVCPPISGRHFDGLSFLGMSMFNI